MTIGYLARFWTSTSSNVGFGGSWSTRVRSPVLESLSRKLKILEKVAERLSTKNNNEMMFKALSPLASASSSSRILFGVGIKDLPGTPEREPRAS